MVVFDVEKWLMSVLDSKIQLKNVIIVCDESNGLLCGMAIDELGNRVKLSQCNARIIIGIISDMEKINVASFLQLTEHPIVKFVKINRNNIIKKMSLVIDNNSNDIYKMTIVDNNGEKRVINDKQEQKKLIELFALQNAVSVSELESMSIDNLEITRVDMLIKKVDVIVDEWIINNGPNVEKIIVLSNNGKIIEYRDIEHIRSIFIALCHQEYPDSVDAINRIQALKLAYRNEFLDKLGNLSIINIVRPIYERIEIIERSKDYRLLPTKIRIVTLNHGTQIYDLITGDIIEDTNDNNCFNNKCILQKNKRNNPERINGIYEIEKHIYLLLKNMESGDYELEKSFFVKYFAEQQLRVEKITIDAIGVSNFMEELEKRQRVIASDPTKIVCKVTYERIEILEYNYDINEHRQIVKIMVVTNNAMFEIHGCHECRKFFEKIAKIKRIDINNLLKRGASIIELKEEKTLTTMPNKTPHSEDKQQPVVILRSFFIKHLNNIKERFKLSNFKYLKNKQKKLQR